MDRRTFLMTVVSTAALPALMDETAFANISNGHSKKSILKSPAAIAAEDEKYWGVIRDEFPITQNLLYFNNGTMGPSPLTVTERVTKRIEHVDSTGDYGGDYEGIRTQLAHVVNAESGDQIAFTHNVSEAISIVSSGIDLKAGDEVLLTNQEHAGNAIPWLARKKRDGIVIKFVPLTDEHWNPFSDDEFVQRVSDAI